MKLRSLLELTSGGPGSGCNPDVGRCGRLPGDGRDVRKGFWPGNVPTDRYYKKDSGEYKAPRRILHNKIISTYENKPSQVNPVIHLVAGGMASGKSTFEAAAQAVLRQPAIVNSDLMRVDLPEYKQVVGTGRVDHLVEESSDVKDATLLQAVGHNNDIQLSAPGSIKLAGQLAAIEQTGYKTNYTYVHRPVEESIVLAANRAATTDKPEDKRPVSEAATRGSHAKARLAFNELAKGRETKVFDGTSKVMGQKYDLIYHKLADGTVLVHDKERMRRFANGEEPKIEGF